MSGFLSWMRHQGLSESSVKKYDGAIRGPLTAWANSNSIFAGSIAEIASNSDFQPVSDAIRQLQIYVERNATGHQMYSSALAKYSDFLEHRKAASVREHGVEAGTETLLRSPVSDEDRLSLAAKLVDAVPGDGRQVKYDLRDGAFRIIANGKQCTSVYFAKNAPGHQIECALDAQLLTVDEVERNAFIIWLETQKTCFGGQDANHHKIGKQVDWFRIGFPTYADAMTFVQRIIEQRMEPNPALRWISSPSETSTVSPATSLIRLGASAPPGLHQDTWEREALRMVRTAQQTTAFSNGQVVSQTVKNKNSDFSSQEEFVVYVKSLLEDQQGRCAISGLLLRKDWDLPGNDDMRASLDRIDSSGHYEAGNLQIVCRFINRWKGADKNSDFIKLIAVLRTNEFLPNSGTTE